MNATPRSKVCLEEASRCFVFQHDQLGGKSVLDTVSKAHLLLLSDRPHNRNRERGRFKKGIGPDEEQDHM